MQEYGGYGTYGGNPQPPQYGGYPPPQYGGYPPPPPPRQSGMWRYLVVAITAAALGAGSVLAVGHSSSTPVAGQGSAPSGSAPGGQVVPGLPNGNNGGNNANGGNGGNAGSGLGNTAQAVYNKVSPGLVIINTSLNYNAEAAAGTGMVLTSDGLVLTNNHVIAGATSISATVLATGKTYRAKVLGYDVTGDIAAIQLQAASGLRTVPLGNSDGVKVGDPVLAMGNAQGQSQIIPATGTVTGLNQTITARDENNPTGKETLHNTIETDAAIVAGDSGGALANAAGQVIGMNTAGNDAALGDGQPTGFAIPINTAMNIVHQITAGQASSVVSIGYPTFVGIFDVPSTSSDPRQQANTNNQNGSFSGGGFGGQQGCIHSADEIGTITNIAPVSSGTLVVGVICGSPAATAGLASGDVITSVNGQQAGSSGQLQSILSKYQVGDTVHITWADLNGQSHTAAIQLVAGPPR